MQLHQECHPRIVWYRIESTDQFHIVIVSTIDEEIEEPEAVRIFSCYLIYSFCFLFLFSLFG